MKIWRLYQRLLCKWFLKSLWIIYSEMYLKQEMTYSCIVSGVHTVIIFFFPRYLKGSTDNYEHVETHMINKGIRVGMEVTRKQNLGTNTEQTMGTTKQAEWNCWEKSWVGFFAVNVRKSYRSFTWKPNNTWSWGALIIATCPWHFSRANSCLGVLEDSGLLVRHRVLLFFFLYWESEEV